MKPEIRTIPDQDIVFVTRTGVEGGDFSQAAQAAFGVLVGYLEENNLMGSIGLCLGLCPDDPQETGSDFRYEAAFFVKPGMQIVPVGEVEGKTLPGGRGAVFTHIGPYTTLWQTWNAVYKDWLPGSGLTLRSAVPYEVYLDDPSATPPEELRTEIVIPIE